MAQLCVDSGVVSAYSSFQELTEGKQICHAWLCHAWLCEEHLVNPASGTQCVIDKVELLRSSLGRRAAAATPLLVDVCIAGTFEVCDEYAQRRECRLRT